MDPRRARRLGAARLRQVRAPAERRRARRATGRTTASIGHAVRAARTRDAGRRSTTSTPTWRRCYAAATCTSRRQARELAIEIVMRPPVPLRCGRCSSWSTRSRSGCCRGDIRRGYGFSWDPARSVALHGGAEYVRRVMLPLLPRRRLRALPRLARQRRRSCLGLAPAPRASRAAVRASGTAPVRSTPRRSFSRPCMRRAEAVAARTSCGS